MYRGQWCYENTWFRFDVVKRVTEDFVKCRLSWDMRVEGSKEVREEERLLGRANRICNGSTQIGGTTHPAKGIPFDPCSEMKGSLEWSEAGEASRGQSTWGLVRHVGWYRLDPKCFGKPLKGLNQWKLNEIWTLNLCTVWIWFGGSQNGYSRLAWKWRW